MEMLKRYGYAVENKWVFRHFPVKAEWPFISQNNG